MDLRHLVPAFLSLLRALALAMCLCALAGCSSSPEANSESGVKTTGSRPANKVTPPVAPAIKGPTADVEILVIDGATGKPAKGVVVGIIYPATSGSITGRTDERGIAVIKGQPLSTQAKVQAQESTGKKRVAEQEIPTGFVQGKNQLRLDLL